MEASSSFLMTLGAACLLVSWVLLMITSWRAEFTWGMVTLLLPPHQLWLRPVSLRPGGLFGRFCGAGLVTDRVRVVNS
jgi:hypothetical protein